MRKGGRSFSFLRNATPDSRGWLADVSACVRKVRKPELTLSDLYAFEGWLSKKDRDNKTVKPKIRQQLQILRDRGVLEFLGRGRYRVLLLPQFQLPETIA